MPGHGTGHYLIYMLPALRLACVAAGEHFRLRDQTANFMSIRRQTLGELEELDNRFYRRETNPERLEEKLAAIGRLQHRFPLDERLYRFAGNVLLRLGRFKEAEVSLQRCLGSPLCMAELRGLVIYDLACIAALTGRPDLCRDLLQQAVSLWPLPQFRHALAQDNDFASVKELDWYQALLR